MALILDLGLEYQHYGYLSRALDAFETVWREGKEATGAKDKPFVDRAIGELTLMQAERSPIVSAMRWRPSQLLNVIGLCGEGHSQLPYLTCIHDQDYEEASRPSLGQKWSANEGERDEQRLAEVDL